MFYKKIRAWHKIYKKMYKVAILDFEFDCARLHVFTSENKPIEIVTASLDELVLMQESGLVDNNDFNTFEGDILKHDNKKYILSFGLYTDSSNRQYNTYYGWFLDYKLFQMPYLGEGEKIGNIFENTKLITGDNYAK